MNDDPYTAEFDKLAFTFAVTWRPLGEATITLGDGSKITGPCFISAAPVIEPVERPIGVSLSVGVTRRKLSTFRPGWMTAHTWPTVPDHVIAGAGYRRCRNDGCEAWGFDHWFDTGGEVEQVGGEKPCPHTTATRVAREAG